MSDAGLPCGHFARCRLVELRVRRKGQEDHARLEEHLQLCSDPSFTTVSLVKKAWFFGNLKLIVFMIFGEMVQVSKSSQSNLDFFLFFSISIFFLHSIWQMEMTRICLLLVEYRTPGDPGTVPRRKKRGKVVCPGVARMKSVI